MTTSTPVRRTLRLFGLVILGTTAPAMLYLANGLTAEYGWDVSVDPVMTSLAVIAGTLTGLLLIGVLRSRRRPTRASQLLILSGCVSAVLLATLAAAWAGDRAHAQGHIAMASACDSPVGEAVIAFGVEMGRGTCWRTTPKLAGLEARLIGRNSG